MNLGAIAGCRSVVAGSMLLPSTSFVVSEVGNLLLMTMVPGIARNEFDLLFIEPSSRKILTLFN